MTEFLDHVKHKVDVYRKSMEENGYSQIVIASGEQGFQFRDDITIPFFVSAYFKEWLPILNQPKVYISLRADSDRPLLYLQVLEDFWHTAPPKLEHEIYEVFDVVGYESFDDLKKIFLANYKKAFIGGSCRVSKDTEDVDINPSEVLSCVDYYRAWKTPYEITLMREANRIGVRGHVAAEQAFKLGLSEYEIHMAYLTAIRCQDNELPYTSIVALNQNAAVLHHSDLAKELSDKPLSFLIDAGAQYRGYASDITRTYASNEAAPTYLNLLQCMDELQQRLIDELKPGLPYGELHELAHHQIAALLAESSIINVGAEEAVATGLSNVFFPHGLGHLIGAQVHDRGGYLCSSEGDELLPPKLHPYLRCTRTVEANMSMTIEPGLYFIPMLLNQHRGNSEAINWKLVDELLPYGGIRIEDDLVLHEDRVENMTREAFSCVA